MPIAKAMIPTVLCPKQYSLSCLSMPRLSFTHNDQQHEYSLSCLSMPRLKITHRKQQHCCLWYDACGDHLQHLTSGLFHPFANPLLCFVFTHPETEMSDAACVQRGSPLTVAINAGNLDMVKLMWKHRSNKEEVGPSHPA